MGGVEPPFMYAKPSSYTFAGPTTRAFDPKSVTRQSWTPVQPKQKTEGPLINFNRHPDSYIAVPYGNLNAKPMNPKTKGRVNLAWKTQRYLRILSLLGALGSLFCIICIRKTSSAVGWIIRVSPAVAVCHLLYAVYFLCRKPHSRSPASCASYQMFAGVLDTGLIPFYAFAAYMAYEDYSKNAYGWSTLFNDNVLDHDIIQSFWLICTCMVGLLCLAVIMDFYLAVTYRKICALPPDMNPLEEDNLTARPRHKRNKSELLHEKHMSNSTLATQRFSQMSQQSIAGRRVPFAHTRTDSADSLTLYGSDSAKQSRVSLRKEMIAEFVDPYGARTSRASAQEPMPSRPGSAVTPSANARTAGAGLQTQSPRSSPVAARTVAERRSSWLSYMDYEGVPAPMSGLAQQELDSQVRPISPVSAMSDRERRSVRTSFEEIHSSEIHQYQPQPSQTLPVADADAAMLTKENQHSLAPPEYNPPRKRSREPLGMNPPTPVGARFFDEDLAPRPLSIASHSTPPRQVLQETASNSQVRPTLGVRPSSFVGSGGKSRFYGNLRTSIGGVGHESGRYFSFEADDDLQRSNTVRTDESGNFEVYGSEDEDEAQTENIENQYEPDVMIRESSPRQLANGQRQTSNSTGYDLHGAYAGLDPEFGKGMATRRRDVSGKVAEEGRSFGGFGRSEQEDGGVITGQKRNGAAGWARFKGL